MASPSCHEFRKRGGVGGGGGGGNVCGFPAYLHALSTWSMPCTQPALGKPGLRQ